MIGLFVLVFVIAVVDLDVRYRHTGDGGRGLGTLEAVYGAWTLLVFGGAYPWPDDGFSRALFLLVPLLGFTLIGQTIARLAGATINRDRWERAMASTYHDHVIVCGVGRLGYRIVGWLLDLGEEVVVVRGEDETELADELAQLRVPVVVGDARRPDVLRDVGVVRARAIVPIADDDLRNLAIATEARRLHPGLRVVLRTFDDRLGTNLQSGFDIHAAYSMSGLAAPAFAAAATHAPVDHAFAYGEGDDRTLLTITKFTVVPESRLVGYTVGALQAEFDVAVIALRRDEFRLHPPAEEVVAAGDGLVVSATTANLIRLSRLTPPTRELARYSAGRWPLDP